MNRRKRMYRRLAVLFVVLAACSLSVIGFAKMREAARQSLIVEARQLGLEAHAQGRYHDALIHLSFYIAAERSDAPAILAFADARSKVPVENNRHLEEAARLYSVVIDLQPHNVNAHLQRMHLYERLHRRLEWHEAANRVLSIDANNVDALRAKAMALYLNSQFNEALQLCTRLIEIEPDDVSWRVFYLQIMQDRGDDFADVIDTCEHWIASHETDGRYQMLKAQLLAAAGEFGEARRAAAMAADQGANEPLVLKHMVSLLDLLGMSDAAATLISDTIVRFPREHWAHEASVRRHWKVGDYERALQEIQHVSAEYDRLGGGLLRWKQLLLAIAGKHDLQLITGNPIADDDATASMERDIDLAWSKAASARLMLDAADVGGAIRTYQQAMALVPSDPVLHFLAAEAYARAGEHHLAAGALEHALRAEPGWVAAQSLYARTLLQLERYETAASIAANLLHQHDVSDLDTCLTLARAWMHGNLTANDINLRTAQSSQPVSLLTFLEYLHESTPHHPQVIELLAQAYLREGRRDEATSLIEYIIGDDDAITSELLVTLAQLGALHDLRLDSTLLEQRLERFSHDPAVAAMRARLLHDAGEVDAAMILVDETVDAIHATRTRAAYLVWTGHPDAVKSLRVLLDAANGNVDDVNFVLSQPLTWSNGDLVARAIERLEHIIGSDAPRAALARASYTLRFETTNPAAMAQAMLRTNRVLAQAPDSLYALQLMALLFLASEPPDVEGAVRQLTRAVQAHPRRVELYPKLIRLLQRQGDHLTAEHYLAQMGRLVGKDQSLLHAELLLLESQGDLDSIIARLTDAAGSVNSMAYQIALAATWHRAGESNRALSLLRQLHKAEPNHPALVSVLAQLHFDQGNAQQGLAVLEAFEDRTGSGVSAMLLGKYLERDQQMDDALHWLNTALQRSPGRIEIWQRLADHHLASGNLAEARKVAEAGLQLDPDHLELLTAYVIASIHLGGRERREALRLLDSAECQTAGLAATLQLYDRVVVSIERADYTEFLLADLRELVQHHPEYEGAWRLAIATHAHAGKQHEAANLARLAASRLPASAEFPELATQLLIGIGHLPEAMDMAMTWRQRSRHRPLHADAAIAAIHLELHQHKSAASQLVNHVDRIINERKQSPQRMVLLLRALAADHRFDQLSEIALPLLHEDERWPALLLDIAKGAPGPASRQLQTLARTASTEQSRQVP